MALVRCEKPCGKPEGRTVQYVRSVQPVGYRETAAICGRKGCVEPGLVWLNEREAEAYAGGERIFEIPSRAVKVKVK